MSVFQHRLRELRELKGWSQEELARRLKVSRSKIGNYEQGTREPGFEDLEAIADVFNCTIAFLIENGRVGPDEFYLYESNNRIPMLKGMELTPEERFDRELLRLYHEASEGTQKNVMILLKSEEEQRKKQSEIPKLKRMKER